MMLSFKEKALISAGFANALFIALVTGRAALGLYGLPGLF